MQQRIYIDTSVVGGCFDEEFEEWSNKLFDEFITGKKILVYSDIFIDELNDAPDNVQNKFHSVPELYKEGLSKTKEVDGLANAYINFDAVTKKSSEDALHIAIATINKIDVLSSWNFKHIVNLNRIKKYNAVNLMQGYQVIEIRTPREILQNYE